MGIRRILTTLHISDQAKGDALGCFKIPLLSDVFPTAVSGSFAVAGYQARRETLPNTLKNVADP